MTFAAVSRSLATAELRREIAVDSLLAAMCRGLADTAGPPRDVVAEHDLLSALAAGDVSPELAATIAPYDFADDTWRELARWLSSACEVCPERAAHLGALAFVRLGRPQEARTCLRLGVRAYQLQPVVALRRVRQAAQLRRAHSLTRLAAAMLCLPGVDRRAVMGLIERAAEELSA